MITLLNKISRSDGSNFSSSLLRTSYTTLCTGDRFSQDVLDSLKNSEKGKCKYRLLSYRRDLEGDFIFNVLQFPYVGIFSCTVLEFLYIQWLLSKSILKNTHLWICSLHSHLHLVERGAIWRTNMGSKLNIVQPFKSLATCFHIWFSRWWADILLTGQASPLPQGRIDLQGIREARWWFSLPVNFAEK